MGAVAGEADQVDPEEARRFAVQVAARLRAAGYQALWAGGCVRDQLLGRAPKDYDVATSATPEQIREVFGHRRTLAIGAAFGVITVLGKRSAGQIEVATFRRDAEYSDGRHPDYVTYSTAREDAQRRDFTINGLFYDPVEDRVIDFVDGQRDLERRVVRAIGDPHQRLSEDKLRMLRAVRFAATFDFKLDDATRDAVSKRAEEIRVVSAERIAAEMRRMLEHPSRAYAVGLMDEVGLLKALLPELAASSRASRQQTLAVLERLRDPTFPVALAALLRELVGRDEPAEAIAQSIGRRWKLSNHELRVLRFVLRHERVVLQAEQRPWPEVQRMLVAPDADQLLCLAEAVADVRQQGQEGVRFCQRKLALPPEVLNPEPLLSGEDLKQLQIPPGPIYKRLLDELRDAQLQQQVADADEARRWILRRAGEISPGDARP